MEKLKIAIAELLLAKHIGFSIYKYPNEKEIHLAIEEGVLAFEAEKYFWMTPFWEKSNANKVQWTVLPDPLIDGRLLAKLRQLDDRDPVIRRLPSESTYPEYKQRFQNYLSEIKTQHIGKAILSRAITLDKPAHFREMDVFQKLTQSYPDTFVYLSFHPEAGIWMGASPELLVEKQEDVFSVRALAGTQKHVAGQPVTWNAKEQDEHEMVVEHIEHIFKKHRIDILHKNGPSTWHLKKLLHLRTDYALKESDALNLISFLKDLHPTPAVGGLPVDKALACIAEHELYDREYYSGMIGETDFRQTCHLFINLRCMQIGQEKIALYTGGGITAFSDADAEWEETILKSRTMLDVIQ